MKPRANAAPGFEFAIANEAALPENGWALIAPYGEHPKSRLISKPGRGLVLENYIQVVDSEAIDSVLAAQNRLMPRLKRALVGIPVYKLHPDLAEHSPEAALDEPSAPKETLGVIDQFRKTERGLEAHFTLTEDGARAVAGEGFKFPSIFWWVSPVLAGLILAIPVSVWSSRATAGAWASWVRTCWTALCSRCSPLSAAWTPSAVTSRSLR